MSWIVFSAPQHAHLGGVLPRVSELNYFCIGLACVWLHHVLVESASVQAEGRDQSVIYTRVSNMCAAQQQIVHVSQVHTSAEASVGSAVHWGPTTSSGRGQPVKNTRTRKSCLCVCSTAAGNQNRVPVSLLRSSTEGYGPMVLFDQQKRDK